MRPEAKGYILKEYGSWSVLFIAFIIGLGVSRGFRWQAIPVLLSLSLLINSKQAFTKWVRMPSDHKPLLILIGQIGSATIILLSVFGSDIPILLQLLIFPAAYLLMNKIAGEHFILTELLGFALLSLAAVLAKFTITGGVDVRLFVGVAMYFTAGVFKIKAMLLKKTQDRILTVLYIVVAIYVYHRMHLPRIALLPLAENIVAAATLYKVKLQTTGWIEVAKSLTFLALMIAYF